ncbi:hypothetical protein NPIL_72691 [Nephila pilipes]|uniref:Uncharacterized protein n=1 Tax=Nephila pilipes TaxID=299642 RepID=A0A8X6J002_NEPPI|nr:hypothetical protein NPIL_72691 [Nephila pilipes]
MNWSPEKQEAFDDLKKKNNNNAIVKITKRIVGISYPYRYGYEIELDYKITCNQVLIAVHTQGGSLNEDIIEYAKHLLHRPERKYSSMECEALATV